MTPRVHLRADACDASGADVGAPGAGCAHNPPRGPREGDHLRFGVDGGDLSDGLGLENG